MDAEQSWHVIAEQRRAVAGLLDGLTPAEWESPSLCDGWRVRDVAAHLVLTPQAPGPLGMLATAVRFRGDFDRMNRDTSVAFAGRPTAELVGDLRRLAGSRRRPFVTTRENLHFDVIVHGQDIAVPLGREIAVPVAAAVAGLQRVWRMGWPFHARRRLRELHLVATDADWSAGEGAEVRGPALSLLLLVTGRTDAARPALHGPGTALLPAGSAGRTGSR